MRAFATEESRLEVRKSRDPLLVGGVLAALVVSLGLGVWVVVSGPGVGAAILLVPCVAAGLGYLFPRSPGALCVADALLAVTVLMLAISWVGFLYLPSLVLVTAATLRQIRRRGRARAQA